MAREVIIKIIGDDKDIDTTINKLVRMGKVDDENAKKFEQNNKAYKELQNQNLGLIERARLKEKALVDLREKSNSPKLIQKYNDLIAQQRTKVEQLTNTQNKQVSSLAKMQDVLTTIGATMSVAFAVQKLMEFGAEIQKLATTLELDGQKSAIVFGDELQRVTQIAKDNANAIGLTTNEFIKAAAGTQDLLVPLQFTRKEAATMSTDLTKLAGALSIWSGGQYDATQTSQILTKALLGETEQLKTLGIQIDQSSQDFNNRIKESMIVNDVTKEQARAMDILNQIMTKSVDAQTNFAGGQMTIAQETAIANAKLREQEEELARASTPFWTFWAKIKTTVYEGGNLQVQFFKDFVKGIKELPEAQKLAFDLLLGRFDEATMKYNEFKKANDNYVDGLKASRSANAETTQSIVKQVTTLESMELELSKLKDELKKVEVGSDEFKRLKGEIDKADASLKAISGSGGKLSPVAALNKEIADLTESINNQALKGDIAESSLRKYTIATNKLRDAQKLAADEVEKYGNIALMTPVTGQAGVQKIIEKNNKEAAEKRDKDFNKWAEYYQSKQDMAEGDAEKQERINDQIKQSTISTVGELGSTFAAYYSSRIAQVDELVAKEIITEEEGQRRKNDLLRQGAEAERLFRIFGIITKTAESVMAALLIPPPFGEILAGINAGIGAAQLSIVQNTPLPGFAKGTKGKQGSGLARVGEEGEELVYLPNGAKVLPNKQTVEHGALIDAMYDNRLDDFILKNYLPKLLPKGASKQEMDTSFIDNLTTNLGKNNFSVDEVVDVIKRLDKNDNKRTSILVNALKTNNQPNLRKR